MTPTRIFISYKRSDAGYAGRVYDSVRDSLRGAELFMDVAQLTPGSNFEARILDFLARCDIFLAIVGPAWVEQIHRSKLRGRDYLRLELESALRSQVWVIPTMVGGARMPEALPRAIRPLMAHHAIDLSDERWTYDVGRLIDSITDVVERRLRSPLTETEEAGSNQGSVAHADDATTQFEIADGAERVEEVANYILRRIAMDGIQPNMSTDAGRIHIVCEDLLPKAPRFGEILNLSVRIAIHLRERGRDLEIILTSQSTPIGKGVAKAAILSPIVGGVTTLGGNLYRSARQNRLERACRRVILELEGAKLVEVDDDTPDR
jgi:hypothetical protein